MDQAALADQGFLRYQRQRGNDPNLGRGSVYVLVTIVRKPEVGGQSVPNSADSQPHPFREGAHFMRFQVIHQETNFVENVNQPLRLLTRQQ
jgi:hypothetical protein